MADFEGQRQAINSRDVGGGLLAGGCGYHTHEYGLQQTAASIRAATRGVPADSTSCRDANCKAAIKGYHTRMNASAKPERTRLSAEDWEDAALRLIAEQGVGAL